MDGMSCNDSDEYKLRYGMDYLKLVTRNDRELSVLIIS